MQPRITLITLGVEDVEILNRLAISNIDVWTVGKVNTSSP